MRKKVVLNSPRLQELRLKKHKSARKKAILFAVFILIVIIGLSIASRITAFNIKKIVVSGNDVIETKDVEDTVNKEIKGNYLWLFPKTNFLIYPQGKLESQLKDKFKRIKDISVNDKNVDTLEVSIKEYKGEYIWCGVLVPVLRSNTEDNKCYFLDSDGYIFDEAPYFSGDVYFKFYGDASLSDNPSGSYFLKDEFAQIVEFKNALEKMDLRVNSFWIDENREEGNFSLGGQPITGPRIIFKMDSDYAKLAENLQAAISIEPLRTDIKTKLPSLLYVDLRFGNKVYYKFQ